MGRRTFLLPLCALLWWCSGPPDVPPIDQVNLGAVPAVPEAGASTSTNVTTFALNALWLGDTTRDGGVDTDKAWRAFGYDLDDRVTIASSTNVCGLAKGSPITEQIDGNDGIDNAFGANLLYLIGYGTGSANQSKDATSLLATGTWTLQLQVSGLTDPSQSATGLSAQAFVSGTFNGSPAFDDTTDWGVLASSLSDGATLGGGALVRFNTVYVNAGTVVARDATQPLTLPVALLNFFLSKPKPPEVVVLTLRIHDPVVTFVRSDATSATNGTIAGVLETQEVLDTALALTGQLSSCQALFEAEMTWAQDILADGTNAPGTPCNGISIGLGFTAKVIANPTQVGGSLPQPPTTCVPDAGVDGGLEGGVDASAD